jgi:hypothetical protein
MPITTATPSKPSMVNGFGGSGSGGGEGQLDSQSTQLQAGTSGLIPLLQGVIDGFNGTYLSIVLFVSM